MEKHSFSVFKHYAENIMDPQNHTYKWTMTQIRRTPSITDFQPFQQAKHAVWVAQQLIKTTARDIGYTKGELYIKINHGARAGSIAKIINLRDMFIYDRQHQTVHYSNRVVLEFDDGKQIKIKGINLYDGLDDSECAELLIGYDGKTVNKFTKNPRVEQAPAEIFDAHGRQINVGDWVMNNRFRPGKVTRISPKGSMWVNYLALGITAAWGKTAAINCREGIPSDFLKIKTPEEMDTMSQIMDYDLSGFKLDYSVEFGTSDD